MTNKDKKNILEKFSKIEYRVKELEKEREVLWSRATSANLNYNGMPKGNSKTNKIENTVEQMEKLIKLIDDELNELNNIKYRIMMAIKELPNITERQILHLKYIGKTYGNYHKRMSLLEIANELGYSVDRINHIHGDALRNLNI